MAIYNVYAKVVGWKFVETVEAENEDAATAEVQTRSKDWYRVICECVCEHCAYNIDVEKLNAELRKA